jgi:acyl dehydratase
MAENVDKINMDPLDTTETDKWVGKPLGGGQLKEPITVTDIRRWAQGMQNPNPLHYDEKYAAESAAGEILAPQSFTVNCTVGHGAVPAIQGYIPGTHMLFGGDEWWFYGPRIRPGDKIRSDRMLFDYRVTHTKFAGPTMFSRGDTTYINQHGEVIAKGRSTSIRYRAENARAMDSFGEQRKPPEWTIEDLDNIEAQKFDYYKTFHNHMSRFFNDVKEGEELPVRPIGPHTLQTFTSEWRAYIFTVWGTDEPDDLPNTSMESGWLPEMSRDMEKSRIDPTYGDGLYYGPSRGHVHERYAQLIGVPRGYGYGATMGAWVLDYLANWGGELGFVVHCNARYIGPAFVGDATFLTGRVTKKEENPRAKNGIITVDFEMKNQSGMLMAKGPAEIRLPLK